MECLMSTKLVNEMEKGNIKWWDNAQGQNSERAKACINFVVGYIDVAGCTTGKFPLVHDLTKINFSGNEFNNTAIA